jgi:alpha-beta hydrolase superfamily lysophospholipase
MMGKNLRNEIIKVLTEKHPEFLDPSVGKEKLRVSFIAHSMGGLIIRSALQEKELASCLLNKLHLFISLAVPHLGTLFPDSNLVSTGMWALSKFKNCVSLKVINNYYHPVNTQLYCIGIGL